MAKPSLELIDALRTVARKLDSATAYQWGHMGSCNCGFLAQEITRLTPAEIHRRALLGHGDWTEQLNDYCSTSGLLFDDIIADLIRIGFSRQDLINLERLADPEVLSGFPFEERNLKYNSKSDAVRYMQVWASQLEERLVQHIQLPAAESWLKHPL